MVAKIAQEVSIGDQLPDMLPGAVNGWEIAGVSYSLVLKFDRYLVHSSPRLFVSRREDKQKKSFNK